MFDACLGSTVKPCDKVIDIVLRFRLGQISLDVLVESLVLYVLFGAAAQRRSEVFMRTAPCTIDRTKLL